MTPNPWKNASSVADLGHAMADWLEGRIPTWPGYLGTRPDDETRHLIPTLVAACRAGFVTTNSQPGHPPVRGWDGRTYRQRAWVEGWITDTALLGRLRNTAKRQGITVITHQPGARSREYVSITEADGECCTGVGHHIGHRKLIASEWPGIGRRALHELRAATYLVLIDLEWGRNNRLWPALDRAIGR